jgi:hypothetical protein
MEDLTLVAAAAVALGCATLAYAMLVIKPVLAKLA